jgi:cobalt-precorrin-7 (C5)-methyltransferase
MVKLNIVGTGPGSPEYITLAAKKAVQQAELVVGAQKSIELFKDYIRGETLILTAQSIQEALKQSVDSAKNDVKTVLLSTGDPGFAGLLRSVLDHKLLSSNQINVIPAVSSLQVCAARLVICWDSARLFSFHEGVTEEKKAELAKAVLSGKDAFVLPDPKTFPPKEIASYLLNQGVKGKTQVFLCENLTLENEKILASTLAEAVNVNSASLCIMVIKK